MSNPSKVAASLVLVVMIMPFLPTAMAVDIDNLETSGLLYIYLRNVDACHWKLVAAAVAFAPNSNGISNFVIYGAARTVVRNEGGSEATYPAPPSVCPEYPTTYDTINGQLVGATTSYYTEGIHVTSTTFDCVNGYFAMSATSNSGVTFDYVGRGACNPQGLALGLVNHALASPTPPPDVTVPSRYWG